MKKIIITLIALLCMTTSSKAMSYEQARREAYFLTDKMAYELNLTPDQYDAAYEINLDYLMGVATADDVFSDYWRRRNLDMSYILLQWQWDAFCAATYFYRPLYWSEGFWHFAIYARYPRRNYFYFSRPTIYISYRGGHSWRSNGGRSYYHSHRDHFRKPAPSEGMRDRWNRGEFKGNRAGGNSSTRITVNNVSNNPNNRFGNSRRGGSFNNNSTTISGNRPSTNGSFRIGSSNSRPNNTTTNKQPTSTTRNNTFGGARNSGSFSNSRRSDNSAETRVNVNSGSLRNRQTPGSVRNSSFRSVRSSSGPSTRNSDSNSGHSNNRSGFSGRR